MIELVESARQLQDLCDRQGWRSCVIGGIAVIRWGETRVTRDIDINVLAGFGGEDRVIDGLLANYAARLPDARAFAIRNRVLLLNTPTGTGIDVSFRSASIRGNGDRARVLFCLRSRPGTSHVFGRGPDRDEAIRVPASGHP